MSATFGLQRTLSNRGVGCSYTLAAPPGSYTPTAAPTRRVSRISRGLCVRVRADYDPEGLFKTKTPEEGIIERRLRQRAAERDKDFAAAMLRAQTEAEKAVLTRRMTRTPPEDNYELVEYLLNTDQQDIEFEAARCRPKLTSDFFKVLDTLVGNERFAAKPDPERLAELEVLRKYLEDMTKAVDVAVAKIASAADRMKKLLTAKDKKQMILDMAADNELDQGLVLLLQQNIDAAREAGQEEAAAFMEKVKGAISKFVVK